MPLANNMTEKQALKKLEKLNSDINKKAEQAAELIEEHFADKKEHRVALSVLRLIRDLTADE